MRTTGPLYTWLASKVPMASVHGSCINAFRLKDTLRFAVSTPFTETVSF